MSERVAQSTGPAGLAASLGELGFEATVPTPGLDEAVRVAPGVFRATASRESMTTRVAVTVFADSPAQGLDQAEAAFREMNRVVHLLDRHDGSSAVSVLNDQGRLRHAPPELTTVLRVARRVHDLSVGTFDATVQPLVDFQASAGPGEARTPPEELLALVDMRAVRLRGSSVSFARAGMGVTLDGIAKGYVVDRMGEALTAAGAGNWLIDAGGDIRVSRTREDGRPWRVAVQDPDKRGAYPAVTELAGGAVATSGSYERGYDSTRHHIVSSVTGRSPNRVRSTTVRAPSTMVADALATTLFAMEPTRALAFIDSIPGCSCLVLGSAGEAWSSSRWQSVPHPTTRG